MMCRGILLLLLSGVFFAGCSFRTASDYDSETLAGYHMQRADSLEAANLLGEAAFEYKLVAELYPTTSHFPGAVRNTALLYSNPANPALDDSISLAWFEKYLTLPISREERTKAEIYVTMLSRITSLRNELNRKIVVIDSLQNSSRKQLGDLASRNRRIQDLEAELKQATVELQKLREVDVRINRRKAGK